jgi:hypothetical protein
MLRRGGLLIVAAACAAAAACGQPQPAPPPSDPPASSTTGLAGSFTDVRVLAEDDDPYFFYKTRISLRDCGAQRTEMPLVWHEHVRGRLKDGHWTHVTLFPEEPSGASASFTFTRRASGEWRADAPCLVTIAP